MMNRTWRTLAAEQSAHIAALEAQLQEAERARDGQYALVAGLRTQMALLQQHDGWGGDIRAAAAAYEQAVQERDEARAQLADALKHIDTMERTLSRAYAAEWRLEVDADEDGMYTLEILDSNGRLLFYLEGDIFIDEAVLAAYQLAVRAPAMRRRVRRLAQRAWNERRALRQARLALAQRALGE